MATKRYQLLRRMSLTTHFDVDGTVVVVSFAHGTRSPYVVRGRFSTNNEGLQKAIESSNSFGKDYFLEETYEDPEEGKALKAKTLFDTKDEAPVTDSKEKVPEETPAKVADDDTEVKSEEPVSDHPDITTVTAARQKLLELFDDLRPGVLKNKVEVLAVAREKNVSFSKLG